MSAGGHFLIGCSDTCCRIIDVGLLISQCMRHRHTDRQTDGRRYHANSRSFCAQYDRPKISWPCLSDGIKRKL